MTDHALMQWEDEGGRVLPEPSEPFNLTNMMARWSEGTLSDSDCLVMFRYLVDTRLLWSLPSKFAEYASQLIEQGQLQQRVSVPAAGISDFYAMGGGD